MMPGAAVTALALTASWATWHASRRSFVSPRERRAWRWVTLALVCRAAAGASQLAYSLASRPVGYPSLVDLFALCSYPALLAALADLSWGARPQRRALAWLDGTIVALAGTAAYVYLVTAAHVVPHGGALAHATSLAYPAADVLVLVALGAGMARSGAGGQAWRTFAPLAAASAALVTVDLVCGSIARHDAHPSGAWLAILGASAAAVLLLAATLSHRLEGTAPSTTRARAARWVPYAAMTVILATALATQHGRPFVPDLAVAIVVVLSGTLVVARQIVYQRNLRESRERLAHAQELARLGSWDWEVQRDAIAHSDEALRLRGLQPGAPETTLARALDAIHPDDRDSVERALADALREARPFCYEARVVAADGQVRTLLTRGDVEVRGGRVTRVRGTDQDVTERRRIEAELLYRGDHDPLTGLYNRHRFLAELERSLSYAARYDRPGALVMLDIDDFKLLNDAHGHRAGDELLQAVGDAISARAREADVLARLGGDEFAILLPESDEWAARAVVEDLRRDVAACGTGLGLHASAGIVTFAGRSGLLAEDALVAADIAIGEAKERGKDQVRVYRGRADAAVTWVSRIRGALAEERLTLFAQPIVDLRSGRLAYRELLLRMLDVDGSLIPPDAFLPTAERFGLVVEIDRWVVAAGLRLAARGERVTINLSAHSIGDERIFAAVERAVAGGVDPRCVVFEITETAAMTNTQDARRFTEALVSMGCDVALDDFGTGFGSFAYLKHLPARYVKIDMEFVRDMTSNTTDSAVVRAIADVAHTLGKRTIAEGVEERATLQALRTLGVDYGQGFLLGRPQPLSPALLAGHERSGSAGAAGSAGSLASADSADSAGSAGSLASADSADSAGAAGSLASADSAGAAGSSGSVGSAGAAGSLASAGSADSAGAAGSLASAGAAGAVGSSGSAGAAGAVGSSGSAGSAGDTAAGVGRA